MLWLLLTVLVGMYLAFKGWHPRQLRRRIPHSRSGIIEEGRCLALSEAYTTGERAASDNIFSGTEG